MTFVGLCPEVLEEQVKQARLVASALIAGVLAAGSVLTATPPGAAQQTGAVDSSAAEQVSKYPTGLRAAIQRDLGTEPITYAANSLASAAASATSEELRDQLGDNFGGAWFDAASGKLNVAVTSQSAADAVRQSGAEAHIRGINEARLTQVAGEIRQWVNELPAERRDLVYGLSTSARGSSVTLVLSSSAEGRNLASELPVDRGAELDVDFVAQRPDPQQGGELRGGQGIIAQDSDGAEVANCSLGFNALDAQGRALALTSGHCLSGAETVVAEADGSEIGTVDRVVWDSVSDGGEGDDYASVRLTNSALTLRPEVVDWQGGSLPVEGVVEPIEGMQVCKSGRTTEWECGEIQQVDVEVRVNDFDGGVKTQRMFWYDACTERGDSGGAVLAGTLAVGLHAAGALTATDQHCLSTVGEEDIAFAEPLSTDVLGDFGEELRLLTTTADTDGDGVPDHEELAADPTVVRDDNGDGVPAYLDRDEPVLSVPVVTSPEDGSRHTDRSLPITGTAKPGAAVTVTHQGEARQVEADGEGRWQLPALSELPLGHYEITVAQSWTAPNLSEWDSAEMTTGFFVAPGEPTISAPQDGTQSTEARPMILGSAEPAAVVAVMIDEVEIGSSVADDAGDWSVTVIDPLLIGTHVLSAVQVVDDVRSNPRTVHYTVLPGDGLPTATPSEPGPPAGPPPTGGGEDLADTGASAVVLLSLIGAAGLITGAVLVLRHRRRLAGPADTGDLD
ncbi:trypsin-like serine protease [Actinoalloteichus sp. GBA129-24]|uniref:trypsin-like serine protease n=1 Tax=Actinoalloteichus sp. GBA129-24 TaxID=1612551 RepID=UPI0009507DD7|nr:trypsin-like serine protease [Actinoalloteichus sp. GBA129-24]APU18372.1 Trypsin [Actinoalloteichus sp. GBA129-24]